MSAGFFITVEGLDGCGKTTQSRLLTGWLQQRGYEVVQTRQPGGTETGSQLRSILLNSRTGKLAPLAELAMMFADRAQSLEEVILPALRDGKVVVCDRYTDSTEAYQGAGRGLGSAVVLDAHRLLCGGVWPQLTLLIQTDVRASLRRARRRIERAAEGGGPDEARFEREALHFFSRVADGYEAIAAREPQRVIRIAGDGEIEGVHTRIVDAVEARLPARS